MGIIEREVEFARGAGHHLYHAVSQQDYLEPISKLSEEDNEASELDKAEEVLSVEFPADEYAALPLYPAYKLAPFQ